MCVCVRKHACTLYVFIGTESAYACDLMSACDHVCVCVFHYALYDCLLMVVCLYTTDLYVGIARCILFLSCKAL